MVTWDHAALRAHELRHGKSDRSGTRPVTEKLDVRHREQEKPRVEAKMRQSYRVSITFLMSDNRVRDLDAGTTTLLDCIIAARRQMADNLRASNPGEESKTR